MSGFAHVVSLHGNQSEYCGILSIEFSSMMTQEQFLELFESIASFVPDGTVVRINNMSISEHRWELEQSRCEL
ncbi:MAG: hypothetical protein EBS70_01865 [Actinobacteria bacterium]|nr:hypothetical protein [Actinomycetota bacterium]